MHFTVTSDVFAQHPNLSVGIIIVSDMDNTGSFSELSAMLREEESKIMQLLDLETYRQHPNLFALQEVHRSFGSNPNKFPPSVQALIKRILKGGQLPIINPLVDLYNVISLRYITCAGAEDTDMCEGDIQLTYADGTEHFLPLGEEAEDPPVKGELLYKDDIGGICRKFNWREADRTKITDRSKNCVIVIEAIPPFNQLQEALEDCASLVRQYCKAETRIEVLTREEPECVVE